MDGARLGGPGRADSSPCPVKTGIQEALPKTVLPRQGECGRGQRVIRYQPVIAEEPAPAEAGGRNPESEHWRPLSLNAGCTPDGTLPADATGLDSGLRRNDIVRGHMGT